MPSPDPPSDSHQPTSYAKGDKIYFYHRQGKKWKQGIVNIRGGTSDGAAMWEIFDINQERHQVHEEDEMRKQGSS